MLARMTSPRKPRSTANRRIKASETAAPKKRTAAAHQAPSKPDEPGPTPIQRPAKRSRTGSPSTKRTRSSEAKSVSAPRAKSARGSTDSGRPRTAAQREAAFDALVRSACLKAGTAAAISSITGRVPLLGRLAPTVLGPLAETVALAQVQKQLVMEIVELYEVALSEPEMRGVVLLATATNIGAQQLSKRSLDAILKQFGEGLIGTVAARVLPMATILAEITAAVASTYTVAKRAQALCKLPGTGAGNLADLLRGLSGIDQQRLLSWSGEAFRLALVPFRSVLGMLWK